MRTAREGQSQTTRGGGTVAARGAATAFVAALCGGLALTLPAAALAAPNCGSTSNLPAGATAESTFSSLQTAVAAVTNGNSGTFYLTSAMTAPSGQDLSIASGASVTLDLDGCSLTITSPGGANPGIGVPSGASLTIEDTSSLNVSDQGTLTATGGPGDNSYSSGAGAAAGIGGSGGDTLYTDPVYGLAGFSGHAGSITINGGNVAATGGSGSPGSYGAGAAGIGGGGGDYGAGGGYLKGTVTVNGGYVTATGGAGANGGSGAGIGGGGAAAGYAGSVFQGYGGNLAGSVVINGGTVQAAGGASSTAAGAGAGIGGGGGGDSESSSAAGAPGGNLAGSLTVTAGSLTAMGGSVSGVGGGGAGIGGGGGGESPGTTAYVNQSLTGTVDIQGGIVSAIAGSSSYAGAGAAVGGGGVEITTGGNGGGVTLSGGTLDVTPATGNFAGGSTLGTTYGPGIGPSLGYTVYGNSGTLTIAAGSAAPVLSGEVHGGLSVQAGATLAVNASSTLSLDGANTNDGTIDLSGVIGGSGTLTNNGAITVNGSSWSADGHGPGATAGATITGNAFHLAFTPPTGATPPDLWVFAPTVAASGESLPTPPTASGYTGSGWLAGSTVVGAGTPLGPLAQSGLVQLISTLSPVPAQITAPSSGTYGASTTLTATGAGASSTMTLGVEPASSGVCALSNVNAGTVTSSATVTYTGVGACVIDVTEAGAYATSTTTTAKITVAKAPLTVTASGGSIVYGGTPPAITPIYSGFVRGDGSGSLTVAPTCMAPVTAQTHVGSYASTCAGAASADYAITYAPGSVAVRKTTSRTTLTARKVGRRRTHRVLVMIRVTCPGAAVATGWVTIYSGRKVVRRVAVRSGRARVTLSLHRGSDRLRAVYAGSSDITGSTSARKMVRVR